MEWSEGLRDYLAANLSDVTSPRRKRRLAGREGGRACSVWSWTRMRACRRSDLGASGSGSERAARTGQAALPDPRVRGAESRT